jgi:hypothetical protein
LTSLVKQIDSQIAKQGELKAFVVVLTDDADKTADTLRKLAKDGKIGRVPLTLVESPSGPPAYKIAEDADVTVMMWRGAEVKVNRAFAKGKLTDKDIASIVTDTSKILSD